MSDQIFQCLASYGGYIDLRGIYSLLASQSKYRCRALHAAPKLDPFERDDQVNIIQGFPAQVVVGQTQLTDPSTPSPASSLAGFNLALHVGDNPERVHQHRMQLLSQLAPLGAKRLTWMNQIHSTDVSRVDETVHMSALSGDALISTEVGHGLMMMTADCLAIVLCNAEGTEVANLHAGWRGLANGVIQHTVAAMSTPVAYAWMGVAISQTHFEVGAEVREIFLAQNPNYDVHFKAGLPNKYDADLYGIARDILTACGVKHLMGGNDCSYANPNYYSYRRDAKAGRMASFVFIRACDF